jgi:hypothetical protein
MKTLKMLVKVENRQKCMFIRMTVCARLTLAVNL